MYTLPTDTTPHPARQYGRHYDRAINLAVGEIAALIVGDLIRISTDPDPEVAFPARIRYAAQVYPRHDTIRIMVYGLTDTELERPFDTPTDGSPCPIDYAEIIETVANAYGWTNPSDPDDRRFLVHVTTLGEDEQTREDYRVGEVLVYPHRVPAWLMSAAPAALGSFAESADI